MHLYIVRHGDAIDPLHPSVTSDEMRELTGTGRAEVAMMASMMQRLGVRPSRILTSPLIRARRTAELLADTLGAESIQECNDLAPGGSPSDVLELLDTSRAIGDVIASGHMPGVGALAGLAAIGDPNIVLRFRTAQICRIDFDGGEVAPGAGDLRWTIPPRVAEKLLGAPD